MLLSEIFDQLTHGELSQLKIGGAAKFGINESDYPLMIGYVNLALTEIHKRFALKTGKLVIQMYDTINIYHLSKEFAVSNTASLQPIKYIVDTAGNPFLDNVIKIEQIKNLEGEVYGLNNYSNPESLYTPSQTSIEVANPDATKSLYVSYRANHFSLTHVGLSPSKQPIDLSTTYLEPLLYYVAYRAHSPLGGKEFSNEGQLYLAKYEASCKRIEELALVNKQEDYNLKLELNGWV